MMLYGQEYNIISISPHRDIATVRVKMAEARSVAMDEENIVSGTFGGYGGSQVKRLPLRDVLTKEELADWRFIKWLYKSNYHSLPFVIHRTHFIKQISNTPRLNLVKRVTARGNLAMGIVAKDKNEGVDESALN